MKVGTTFFFHRMRHKKLQAPYRRAAPSPKRGRRPDVRIVSKAPTWRHSLVSWRSIKFCLQQKCTIGCHVMSMHSTFGIRYNRDSMHSALALTRRSIAPVCYNGGSSAGALLITFYPVMLSRRSGYQYNETNEMHFSFNLLGIKSLYMLLILRKCHTNGT
jgi:hypothetical protein